MTLVPAKAKPVKLSKRKLTKGQKQWRAFAERYRENLAFKIQVKFLLRQSTLSIIKVVDA